MTKKIVWMLGLLAIGALPALAPAQAPLSPKHKTWLEEEVPYIITTKERDVFYKLETDGDRDLLIEEFWKQRDPTPGTWVAAQANPPADDPYYAFVLGNQFLNKGDIDTGQAELFKAYSKKPDSLEYALSYAQVLLVKKEPAQARDILLPFAKKDIANFELYQSLGKACQETAEFKEAIAWYQKALALKGNVIAILNSLGECYLKLGDKDQALRAWKKSLELNPSKKISRK